MNSAVRWSASRRSGLITSGAAALLVAVLAVVLSGCAGLPPAPGDNKVTIADLKFIPTTIVVQRGSTVMWTNNDQTAHTVTADTFPEPGTTETPPPGSFTSLPLSPGQSFSHRFDTPGTFPYHCQIHTYLKGTVIVK